MATWRELITKKMKLNKENLNMIVFNTMTDEEMDVKFDDGYGGTEGIPFTIWTKKYVYFPTEYDGSEDVASVRRSPCKEPTFHI